MILFETDRLVIRQFTTEDADAFFAINGNAHVMEYIRPAKNRQESDDFLAENIALYLPGSVIGRYAAIQKSDQQLIGTFSLLYLGTDTDIHIGYALLPDHWGKGFATELTINGTTYFFNHTNKQQLFAITDTRNLPSQKVLLKAGFGKSYDKMEGGREIGVFVRQV